MPADRPPIRTKIVATIGPASRPPAVLRRLVAAGVNVFRLNFSHGTHEEHAATLADIRAVGRETGRHVGVLQDLCGPKMRLGPQAADQIAAAVAPRGRRSPRSCCSNTWRPTAGSGSRATVARGR